jgi:hypothetical protein
MIYHINTAKGQGETGGSYYTSCSRISNLFENGTRECESDYAQAKHVTDEHPESGSAGINESGPYSIITAFLHFPNAGP